MTSLRQNATDDSHRSMRALVVAAPGEEREQLEMLLGREHILPFTAVSCETAIAGLSESPFDIVLSNMALGGPWDGLGLARWVLSHQPTTGIILLSNTFPWIASNSPLSSVAILMRPVVEKVLMEKVRNVVAECKGQQAGTATLPC